MRDGIELSKRGIPAIVLLPRGLEDLARDKADLLGMPDLPLAIIDAPLYGLTAAQQTATVKALRVEILEAIAGIGS